MSDEPNPEMEERWQKYLRRRKRGKYLTACGVCILTFIAFLAFIPPAVAAYSGTVYVGTPWNDYLGLGMLFGLILIVVGIISMIAPNMMEGDALWIFKLGPFDPGW